MITILGAPNTRVITFARATLFVILLPAAHSLPRLASVCAGLMARTMEQMEQLIGHALSRVDDVEKLHDRLEAETKSSMKEWTGEARTAGQLIQALQAQVSTLQLRLAEFERAPVSGGSSRPPTLEEIIERRSQLQRIKDAGMD